MTFTSKHRFNITAFAIATAAVVSLNGSMLMGFNHVASAGDQVRTEAARLAKANASLPTVTLERVVVASRRV